jgi:hypothetical protein
LGAGAPELLGTFYLARRPQLTVFYAGAVMQEIKLKLVNPKLNPRRTKLEMLSWAVSRRRARMDYTNMLDTPCLYRRRTVRIESDFRVSAKDGKLVSDGDFGPAPETD